MTRTTPAPAAGPTADLEHAPSSPDGVTFKTRKCARGRSKEHAVLRTRILNGGGWSLEEENNGTSVACWYHPHHARHPMQSANMARTDTVWNTGYLPDAPVLTHDGRTVPFYEGLIKNRWS